MIKVAFIKYAGLASGGTEINLQTIAANLPKNKFNVDYFYCDASRYIGSDWVHPDTDIYRKKYLEKNNVNLIKFNVEAKDITVKTHNWVNTDFWEKFSEDDYDVIISGRAGHPEYPFIKITKTPIVFFITLIAGVDNQKNIFKNILISDWQAKQWINLGGDASRLSVYPLLRESEFHKGLNKERNTENFTYGFHQRSNDDIFSEVPLLAYKKIMSINTEFKILGGSIKYSEQAKKLNLINFNQYEHTGSEEEINKFLQSLDVFSHGRNDGETFGLVFTEAMHHKLPMISHKAQNNAQVEVIGDGGKVFSRRNIIGYAMEMKKLKNNINYYNERSKNSYNRYVNIYSLEKNIKGLTKLIQDAANWKFKPEHE